MIARLFVLLPFSLTVPEGQQFPLYEDSYEGYDVWVFPPLRSDRPSPVDGLDEIKLDGVPAFQADVLRIDFRRESFDRRKDGTLDPPEHVITRAVNSFLVRLRYVTRAGQVRPVNFPKVGWRLRYLNDDETELEKDENLVRGRGTLHFSLSWIALNKQVWEDIHNLPVDFDPPPWDGLLLDANAELPNVGPAIVLAATALEVFISHNLDRLMEKTSLPAELWKWINERSNWLGEPTLEEQYDVLLKFFTGHSLKDEQKLWESYKNLKTMRNSFVHAGTAKLGGKPATAEMTLQLIATASEIVSKVREWLPEELHWHEFKHNMQVEVFKKLT